MYQIKIIPAAQKDLDRLEDKFFRLIQEKILSLADQPRPSSCVKLTAEEGYRIRSGIFRILYRIDDQNKIVYIYRVKHRKEAYR